MHGIRIDAPATLALTVAMLVCVGSCGKKDEPAARQEAIGASGEVAGSETAGAARAAPSSSDPNALLKEIVARLPSDVDDAFVMRLEPSDGDESEVLTALAALIFPTLPLPDELVMHGLAHGTHGFVFGSLDFAESGVGLVWYDSSDLEADLPRASGAMLAPHKGVRPGGGCEEDGDDLRTVQGLRVHGDADALRNTVCIDDRFAARMTGDYTGAFVARTSAGEVGKSAAGLLAAEQPLGASVRMVAAWASEHPEPSLGIDRALISVEYAGATRMTTVSVRVHPRAGMEASVRAAFDATWQGLEGAARELTAATEIRTDAGWVAVRFAVDDGLRQRLFAQVPDSLRAYEVILERQARRGGE